MVSKSWFSTHIFASTILVTSLCSPSATWITSSINPAPILFSSSDMLV